MQKSQSQENCDLHVINHSRWLSAAKDFRAKISQYQRDIRALKRSVKLFEENAKRGVPWPDK